MASRISTDIGTGCWHFLGYTDAEIIRKIWGIYIVIAQPVLPNSSDELSAFCFCDTNVAFMLLIGFLVSLVKYGIFRSCVLFDLLVQNMIEIAKVLLQVQLACVAFLVNQSI
eukprot:TRINITY_DN7794_c0_g1_i1.p1 TRINITY_DN7794_c0_g1~~TRINITY_DN7794_c0_g1_i1.p1  ORF type:complete len:112 (-),score=6.90 TRINITY_DN7794_c0_g1_i1:118-453(-)